ncbi:uncharacterized protein LOC131438147 [Malaya genurostris]|uniref:uncharacterized protein LOC131438147 n=1 Tax=Malaya genurostris TaxID=325434 RepID=UPI0026F40286|nr:uncharacterized protein LOC131438147 [Malaya genurostris]
MVTNRNEIENASSIELKTKEKDFSENLTSGVSKNAKPYRSHRCVTLVGLTILLLLAIGVGTVLFHEDVMNFFTVEQTEHMTTVLNGIDYGIDPDTSSLSSVNPTASVLDGIDLGIDPLESEDEIVLPTNEDDDDSVIYIDVSTANRKPSIIYEDDDGSGESGSDDGSADY